MSSLKLNTGRKNKRSMAWIVGLIILFLLLFICYVSYDDLQKNSGIKSRNEKIKDYEDQIAELSSENKSLKSQIKKYKEDKQKAESVENYYLSYSSGWSKEDMTTTLQLKGDKTFQMNVNICNGVATISGKYSKAGNKITLSSLTNVPQGITGSSLKEIILESQSDGKLKVNNDLGCVFKDSLFTKNG